MVIESTRGFRRLIAWMRRFKELPLSREIPLIDTFALPSVPEEGYVQ
jgi:hypothetical protein